MPDGISSELPINVAKVPNAPKMQLTSSDSRPIPLTREQQERANQVIAEREKVTRQKLGPAGKRQIEHNVRDESGANGPYRPNPIR